MLTYAWQALHLCINAATHQPKKIKAFLSLCSSFISYLSLSHLLLFFYTSQLKNIRLLSAAVI